MEIGKEDFNKLKDLEESMWKSATRFDRGYMDRILAPGFFEFGRSGRIYTREETLSVPEQEIKINLPLKNFTVNIIDERTFLITYVSEEINDNLRISNRSSIWIKSPKGWRLRFHQGTPVN